MKLPTYILFSDLDNNPMILQMAWPSYVGHFLYGFTDIKEPPNYIIAAQVAGYKIHIVIASVLHGDKVPWSANPKKDLQAAVDAMASWYLIEVIGKDLERFSHYAL